jgi:hypothetical protein
VLVSLAAVAFGLTLFARRIRRGQPVPST